MRLPTRTMFFRSVLTCWLVVLCAVGFRVGSVEWERFTLERRLERHALWFAGQLGEEGRLVVRDASFAHYTFGKRDLRHADFRGADLSYSNFSQAMCTYADFRDANLSHAVFQDGLINGADFHGALMDATTFFYDAPAVFITDKPEL